MKTGAQIFSRWLQARKHHHIFCLPGLQIDSLLLGACLTKDLRITAASHEAAAGFMADGFARASGRLGICLSIGNVGASNLATALLVAKTDCSPVLFITGAPPVSLENHLPFQDVGPRGSNDHGWIKEIVKSSVVVRHPDDLLEQLIQAETIAQQYPKGPVHLIVPSCVQNAFSGVGTPSKIPDPVSTSWDHGDKIDLAVQLLTKCQRAVGLVGERNIPPKLINHFAKTFAIPMATTLAAKGLLSKDHPMCLGSFGFAGMPLARETLLNEEIDLLILIGVGLNERDSHNWDPRLLNGRTIISLGSGEARRGKFKKSLQIDGDCITSLAEIDSRGTTNLQKNSVAKTSKQTWIYSEKKKHPFTWPPLASTNATNSSGITTDKLFESLEKLTSVINLIVDAGGARIYSGLYWWPAKAKAYFSSCATGAMGWSLGAGAGVYLAEPTIPTVVFIGDGSLWMCGNDLATLAKDRLPILVIVLNNSGYGSVAKRYHEHQAIEVIKTPGIDWCAYGISMGCKAQRIETLEHFQECVTPHFKTLIEGGNPGPLLLEIMTPAESLFPSGALTTNGYREAPSDNGF